MKIEKSELAPKIEKLKNAVSKSNNVPAWNGILLKDGELIAGSYEITVRAKLDNSAGESFIIPAKMFDLIKNLPDGQMSIAADDKDLITIQTVKIKHSFQSLPAEQFPLPPARDADAGSRTRIPADTLKKAVKRVLYAVSKIHTNPAMRSVFLEAKEGKLNFVGTDGHMIAWEQVDFEGSFQLLIPRSAAEELLSLKMEGEVAIEFDKYHAVFCSDEYEVNTQLVESTYLPYAKIFAPMPVQTSVSRKELLDAVTRAGLCTKETPVRFTMDKDLGIHAKDGTADYHEAVTLQKKIPEPVTIAFNPKLLIETLKAFDCENIKLSLVNQKNPMIVESERGCFKAVVLPVAIK